MLGRNEKLLGDNNHNRSTIVYKPKHELGRETNINLNIIFIIEEYWIYTSSVQNGKLQLVYFQCI